MAQRTSIDYVNTRYIYIYLIGIKAHSYNVGTSKCKSPTEDIRQVPKSQLSNNCWRTITWTQDFKPKHIFQTPNFKSSLYFKNFSNPSIYILRTIFGCMKIFQIKFFSNPKHKNTTLVNIFQIFSYTHQQTHKHIQNPFWNRP